MTMRAHSVAACRPSEALRLAKSPLSATPSGTNRRNYLHRPGEAWAFCAA